MARVLAYEIDGELWPVSLEVRLKARPCGHDTEPPDQPHEIAWERSDFCDCWPEDVWADAEEVPSGGLPVRLLKNLRMREFVELHRQAVRNHEKYLGLEHPVEAVERHLSAVAEADKRPPVGRGRPQAERSLHLRRLAALHEAYQSGLTQERAARRLGISVQALRSTVTWARQQNPPLWTSPGTGRPGQLTASGRAEVGGFQAKQGRRRSRRRAEGEQA